MESRRPRFAFSTRLLLLLLLLTDLKVRDRTKRYLLLSSSLSCLFSHLQVTNHKFVKRVSIYLHLILQIPHLHPLPHTLIRVTTGKSSCPRTIAFQTLFASILLVPKTQAVQAVWTLVTNWPLLWPIVLHPRDNIMVKIIITNHLMNVLPNHPIHRQTLLTMMMATDQPITSSISLRLNNISSSTPTHPGSQLISVYHPHHIGNPMSVCHHHLRCTTRTISIFMISTPPHILISTRLFQHSTRA